MGVVIYAFPCSGKTYLTKKYKNIIELASEKFHWEDCDNNTESMKGEYKVVNKEWPNNYYQEILNQYKNTNNIILITHSGSVGCQKLNIPYYIVYPYEKNKTEYIHRMKNRGNSQDVISNMELNFEKYIKSCESDSYALKHIRIGENEYLEEALLKLGLIEE